jgi:hypothetical protein
VVVQYPIMNTAMASATHRSWSFLKMTSNICPSDVVSCPRYKPRFSLTPKRVKRMKARERTETATAKRNHALLSPPIADVMGSIPTTTI